MQTTKKTNTKKNNSSLLASQKAYEHIKEISINFSGKPQTQINELEMAKILGMSRVPVREALNGLAIHGFVLFEHGKGFFYRRFSETEMKNLYDVRLDLEMGSVRRACRHGEDNKIKIILEQWEKIKSTKASFSIDELIDFDEQFHLDIANLVHNAVYINYLKTIYEKIRFLRKIHVENEIRKSAFVDEHYNLIVAILNHAEKDALATIEDHLGANSQELKNNIITGMLRIYQEDIV